MNPDKRNRNFISLFIYGLLGILLIILIAYSSRFQINETSLPQESYQTYLDDFNNKNIEWISYPNKSYSDDLNIIVHTKSGREYSFEYPRLLPNSLLKSWEEQKDLKVKTQTNNQNITYSIFLFVFDFFSKMILISLSILLVIVSLNFLQFSIFNSDDISKKSLITNKDKNISLSSMAGNNEAKEEAKLLIEFLINPKPFHDLGANLPKGVLLSGLPGTGKTMLAKAIASEANVPFFACSGSEFEEKYIGVGASRIRKLFSNAKKNAPCLIFIDEIDSIGQKRDTRELSGFAQTLNQLLVEMDGFEKNDRIIIIGATNRPQSLDKALIRAGRFDKRIYLYAPTMEEREEILKVHTKKIKLEDNFDYSKIVKTTVGWVGADLANLVNESALRAVELKKDLVTMDEFDYSFDKITIGSNRKTLRPTEKELERTAYHEAGHALVSLFLPDYDPIRKITILPCGNSLGATHYVPDGEKQHISKNELKNRLIVCCGGRAAEKIIYGDEYISTGSSAGVGSDLEVGTELAKKMVMQYGFSEKIGLSYTDSSLLNYQAKSSISNNQLSEIENEIKLLLEDSYNKAIQILTKNRDKLELFKDKLLEKETLNLDEIKDIININN